MTICISSEYLPEYKMRELIDTLNTVSECELLGNLKLQYEPSLERLPETTTVHGSLILVGLIRLKSLPKQLTVFGDLDLCFLNVESTPIHTHITGSLSVWRCDKLTTFPDDLYVGEDILIDNNGVKIDMCERLQLQLIEQDATGIEKIKAPTEKAILYHNAMYNL